jgi:PAS domain S-box-containing protein
MKRTSSTRFSAPRRACRELSANRFFDRLVEQLALATHASAAFVAERDPKRDDAVQTLAVWMDGAIRPNFEYELRGTPCEQVFDRTPSEYPVGVQAAFPDDRMLVDMGVEGYVGCPLLDERGQNVGIVVVLSNTGFGDSGFARAVLEIFASRAAGELSRRRMDRDLQQRVAFESHAARLAHSLVEADDATLPSVLDSFLPELAHLLDLEYVGMLRRVESSVHYLFRWRGEQGLDLEPHPERFAARWPWFYAEGFRRETPICVPSFDELPDEAAVDKRTAAERGVVSLAWIPVRHESRYDCAIAVGVTRSHRDWDEETITRLSFIGDLLLHTFNRCASQATLRASEQEFRNLFEGFAHPITIYAADGTVRRMNACGARNVGRRIEDCIGRNLSELLPSMAEVACERAREVLETGEIRRYEDRIDLDDGTHWFWTDLRPFYDDGLNEALVQCTSYDITEQRLAQTRHQAQLQFQLLLAQQFARLLQARPDTIRDTVSEALEAVCQFASVERAFLFVRVGTEFQKTLVHWAADHLPPVVPDADLERVRSEWKLLRDRALEEREVVIPRVEKWTSGDGKLRRLAEQRGYKSLSALSVRIDESEPAILACATHTFEHRWDAETMSRLRIFTEMVCTAIHRLSLLDSLRAQEERLRLALHGGDMGVFDFWSEGRRFEIDEHLAPLLGYTYESLARVKDRLVEHIHPEDWPGMRELHVALNKRQIDALDTECRIRNAAGEYRWFAVRARIVERDPSGWAVRLAGTLQDVTERKHTERILAASYQLETLLNRASARFINTPLRQIDEGIEKTLGEIGQLFRVDMVFLCRFRNERPAFYLTHSWTGERASLDRRRVRNWGVSRFPRSIQQLQRREPVIVHDTVGFRNVSPTDSETYRRQGLGAVLALPLVHQDRVVGFLGLGCIEPRVWPDTDVRALTITTQVFTNTLMRKEAEEQLEQYNERMENLVAQRTAALVEAQEELIRNERLAAIGQVTATVSHEIRNPLGTIRAAVFSIGDALRSGDTERIDRAVRLADRSIQRCDRIITELLDYTRRGRLVRTPIALRELLGECAAECPAPNGFRLHVDVPGELRMMADRERLRRALQNLMNNSIQAMADAGMTEGNVRLAARVRAKRVEIAVEDDGPGIPDDVRERMFEPLFSTKSFGVGLGMNVVRDIMNEHEGGVEVTEAPGGGARVVLWFPSMTTEDGYAE